jgi:hypothetical protein
LLAAHCGPEPSDGVRCTSTQGEVAEGSEWFDEADVRAAEWSTSGKWVYAQRYGYPDTPTTFTLDIRWSGEPYQATLYDCEDGTRHTGGVTIPVTAELVTSDGAFDDVFQAETRDPSSARATYTFGRLPAAQRRGSFMLPASASSRYVTCDSAELGGDMISFDAERRTGTVADLHDPGYSWLHWICTPSWYPIGRPEFDRVARPD